MNKSIYLFVCFTIVICPILVLGGTEQLWKRIGGPNYPEVHEFKYLPSYCKCKNYNPKIAGKRKEKCLESVRRYFHKYPYGGNWIHLHHYCNALTYLNRYYQGRGDPLTLLSGAEKNLDYMIRQSNPKFMLVPEYYLKMGIVKESLNKDSEALVCYNKAIMLNKKYVAPYLKLSDYYISRKDLKSALEIINRGLEYSKESKALLRKHTEIKSLIK